MNQAILEQEILKLPPRERAALADTLLASLDDVSARDIETAWTKEAEVRYQAYKAGQIESLDGPTVLGELRQRYAK